MSNSSDAPRSVWRRIPASLLPAANESKAGEVGSQPGLDSKPRHEESRTQTAAEAALVVKELQKWRTGCEGRIQCSQTPPWAAAIALQRTGTASSAGSDSRGDRRQRHSYRHAPGRANTPARSTLLINRYVSPFLSSPETDSLIPPFIPLPTLPSTSRDLPSGQYFRDADSG